MIRDEADAALAQAKFFDICDDEQRRMLAFVGDRRHFDPDAVIYQAGTVPQGAYILISGMLKAKPEGKGANKSYAISEPGSVVSVIALILDRPRLVTFTAVTECAMLFVPRQAFLKLVQQSPDLAQRAVARIERDLDSYLGAIEPIGRHLRSGES
ncbi:MAG: cyclic nucleotide-binding domain-containing protein [Candidatus Devosia symbiotica]|nr:cyclic nucleotide-binding domain-containing protein [Candidatus Devosia symbiotica]